MSDSELSSVLSSPPASDDEAKAIGPMDKFLQKSSLAKRKMTVATTAQPPSPPVKRKRSPSPPHEEVLADNPIIPVLVTFRARLSEAFPPKCPHLGPQDIERGIVDSAPSPQVESLLCALLGFALNRKKPVEKGHYGRALEETMSTYKSEWPLSWGGINPLSGSRSFNDMSPQDRLSVLQAIIHWCLHGSDVIKSVIKENYKQSRHDDDLNQPLSVQPWGVDGEKRRYWLIEGKDDTPFRLYRESNPYHKKVQFRSVAGTIDELREVATKLARDSTQASRRLSERINAAIPRFEATEDKRKRREYRMQRKAQFARPEPGFSLYEGRTRGKRMKYTFSDDEEETSDALSTRRSTRRGSPVDSSRPVITSSGRQVRSRLGGLYGETLLSGQNTELDSPGTADYERSDASEGVNGRATRTGRSKHGVPQRSNRHIDGYNSIDEMDDEEEVDEWDGGDDDEDDDLGLNDDDEESLADDESDGDIYIKPKGSLVVTLRIPTERLAAASSPPPQPRSPSAVNEENKDRMEIDSGVNAVTQATAQTSISSVETSAPFVESKAQPTAHNIDLAPKPVSGEMITAEPIAKLPSPPASVTVKSEQPEINDRQGVPSMTSAMAAPTTNGHPIPPRQYPVQSAQSTSQ
ncbi:uncharacterized protein BKCO1_4600064 [Diplodia corticola]|uniref:WHIM1 domain-containing protein n=1 Tax=Diplodia corticola TaxID=236234 RepID=A0A1J9QT72_9PEZI|nr:uncharacterized protein BKCO1_4600064 [Diplodia corticola]OJD31640.1 hypothetical protein BKCO1_4600064 [Diplodia corticola]